MSYSNLSLLILVVLWSITLCWYIKKYRNIGTACILLLSFLTFSIFSFIVFNDPFWGSPYRALKIYPFIFLYIMMLLSISPAFKWDRMQIDHFYSKSNWFIISVCWFFIICTLARIGDFKNFVTGLQMMIISSGAGLEIYEEQSALAEMSSNTTAISNILAIFSNLLYDFAVIFLFYLLHKKYQNKILIIGLIISIVICILLPITVSQRGPTLERVLVLFIFYFAMKRFLSSDIKKRINYFFVLLGSLISIPIAFITLSRFEDRGAIKSILSYLGQQNLNFNNYAFNNNGLRYGDRILPVFKSFLGFENVPSNYFQSRAKYSNLFINDEVFVGYVGDFMLDFGPIITFLIILIYTFFTLSKLKTINGHFYLYQLIPFFFMLHVCMYGSIFLFPFAFSDNYAIIVYILMYISLKSFKI